MTLHCAGIYVAFAQSVEGRVPALSMALWMQGVFARGPIHL